MPTDPQNQEAADQLAFMAQTKKNAGAFRALHDRVKSGGRLNDKEHEWYSQVLNIALQKKAEQKVVGLSAQDSAQAGLKGAATGAIPAASSTAEQELKRMANLQMMAEGFGGGPAPTPVDAGTIDARPTPIDAGTIDARPIEYARGMQLPAINQGDVVRVTPPPALDLSDEAYEAFKKKWEEDQLFSSGRI